MNERDGSRRLELPSEMDVHAMADDQLPPCRVREIEVRAARDHAVAEQLAAIRWQNDMLRQIRDRLGDMDSGAFEPALQRKLGRALARRRRERRYYCAAAAAAAIVLSVAATSYGPFGRGQDVPPKQADSLEFPFGSSVLSNASLPTGGGQESLEWLREQLPGGVLHLTEFESMGLHFAGGEMLKSGRSPAVQLMFVDADRRPLSLYVGAVSRGARAAFAQVPEGHVSINWRQGPLVFALIGAADSPRLLEVMAVVTGAARPAKPASPLTSELPPTASLNEDPGPMRKEPAASSLKEAAGPLQPALLPAEPATLERPMPAGQPPVADPAAPLAKTASKAL